jgi:hypothetical protein
MRTVGAIILSGSSSLVAMMQPTYLRQFHHDTKFWRLPLTTTFLFQTPLFSFPSFAETKLKRVNQETMLRVKAERSRMRTP